MKFVLLFAALLVELLDSDLSRASGVLFESLIALAIRDLACSKSLIEFCINSYSSLQCPPSKPIFIFYTLQKSAGIIKKKEFDNRKKNWHITDWNIGTEWILQASSELWRPEKTWQFQIPRSKVNVSTMFLK